MTPKERVLKTLNLEPVDKIPFVDWFDIQMQRDVAQAKGAPPDISDAEFATLIGMDAQCIFDKYLPPVFCETIKGSDGKDHLQGEGLIKSEKDLDKMVFLDPSDAGFYDEAKRFVDRCGKEDIASYAAFRTGMLNTVFSMGMLGFATSLHQNVSLVENIFDRYAEWTCTVLEKLQTLGFDFLMCFDDIAFNSGTMFSPATLRFLSLIFVLFWQKNYVDYS
ncbi:hypothetical protein SAMN02746065_1722 [Desulfocicer vacuolatum DSM 3385]|uniref:Uroporphyrinogen decarboxylase (URO-D) n=1 Tax=Desulfocicer vacuolatum DSM 3385 TaxID=1121400 RepID=A0A1W2F2Z7_9BACT|nr:hypothetical protein [Desulfocicer vacuolatum]SMD16182.1 hypothetical protein SAMN02746065_1722 [Desulfocicer vacuolatum DSM 3385]